MNLPSPTAAPTLFEESDAPVSLLPRTPSFAGHQTFAMRAGWLKKALDALAADAQFFARDEALVELGVGKNMVTAIRHWVLATGLARSSGRELTATALGELLLRDDGFDPYLEDPATLWVLHWNLCGPGSSSFTFAWAFNFLREWEWTREKLGEELSVAVTRGGGKAPSAATLGRDVDVFLHSYAAGARAGGNSEDGLDCPLRELGLIAPAFEHHFRFAVGPKPSLPMAIFAYALAKFWSFAAPDSATISAREIAHAPGSPGVVFKLDENSTLAYLDELSDCTRGAWRFEDTPLVRQVVRERTELSLDALLATHYNR